MAHARRPPFTSALELNPLFCNRRTDLDLYTRLASERSSSAMTFSPHIAFSRSLWPQPGPPCARTPNHTTLIPGHNASPSEVTGRSHEACIAKNTSRTATAQTIYGSASREPTETPSAFSPAISAIARNADETWWAASSWASSIPWLELACAGTVFGTMVSLAASRGTGWSTAGAPDFSLTDVMDDLLLQERGPRKWRSRRGR